jgi:hypothetical protein
MNGDEADFAAAESQEEDIRAAPSRPPLRAHGGFFWSKTAAGLDINTATR